MTILTTGGCGFIGSNFIMDWLANYDEKVINLDKLTYAGNYNNLASLHDCESHIFIHGDIGDSSLVTKLLQQYKPRAIINFAAESHVDRSIDNPEAFIQTNIVSTFRLLDCVNNYWQALASRQQDEFRLVHISTDEVFGSLSSDAAAFTENHPYQPNSPYSASKASSDHIVRAYHHTYGLPLITTHCSNNYGPYQLSEKLIPLIINNALALKPLPVYGDGLQIRDWLYVSDHCSAIRHVLEGGMIGETYNIGGSNEKTNIEIIHTICSILDQVRPIESASEITRYSDLVNHVEDRSGHDRRYAINSSKIMTELSWAPKETLKSGLAKTIEWYLDNPAWIENAHNPCHLKWIEKHYT